MTQLYPLRAVSADFLRYTLGRLIVLSLLLAAGSAAPDAGTPPKPHLAQRSALSWKLREISQALTTASEQTRRVSEKVEQARSKAPSEQVADYARRVKELQSAMATRGIELNALADRLKAATDDGLGAIEADATDLEEQVFLIQARLDLVAAGL